MIHRTRQFSIPSGAPEADRKLVKIGNIWVEYSGALPTADDLDAHLHPPQPILPLTAEELAAHLIAKGTITQVAIDAIKAAR